ncbi:ABC transporter permease [Glycomyces sp. NPDC046736]|uniref:ABC transporter permease n=1 Tax=Glycomyces sp. NPDC046736 TaxID=3155615 RepID=UPI0033E8A5DE
MTAFTLAAAETRLILRDRTVLVTAAALPLVFAILLSRSGMVDLAASTGALAALQLATLQMFGLFTTVTMTLTARRQQRYLQRLRTSPASTASIVAGLSGPLVLIVLAQTAIVFAYLAWESGAAPARVELLVLAFAIGAVASVALGFLTASFTRSPEAAQITVLPGLLVLILGATMAMLPEGGPMSLLRNAIPGAGAAALTRAGWDGVGADAFGALVAPLLGAIAVAAVSALVAAKRFRWQPR